MGGRPLFAASAAFLAGAFFASTAPVAAALFAALGALSFLLAWTRLEQAASGSRLVARARELPLFAILLGLGAGLLRGAAEPRPPPPEAPREAIEIDAEAVAPGVFRTPWGLASLVIRGGQVHRGDQVLLLAQLHVPSRALNPGGSDRRARLAARGIALEGSAELIEVHRRGPAWFRFLDEVRARFVERAQLLCTSRDRGALVAALAVGDRSELSPEAEDELSASGLVHLLASSGLHLAAVVFLAREAARRLWLRTPWAASVPASAVGAACALPFACAEVLLLGAPWPAVRAGIGAALALVARASSRRPDAATTLFAAAAGCALVDPGSTHELALQLSVVGIGGLLVLTGPLRELLPLPRPGPAATHLRKLSEHLVVIACATSAAALCTGPLIAAAFHRVSLVSVLANALALLPGLAAIPIATALVAVDTVPLWWLANGLAGFTLRAAQLFAALPFATLALAAPGLVACALWYAFVARLAQSAPPRRRLLRAALPLGLLLSLATAKSALAARSGKLTLTFLAIGQGDCTVIQLPGGHAMLVDGGGDLRWPPRVDRGARDILPALAELGIARLDLVVLTHPHPDHAGGLLTVLDRVPVGELWMTAEAASIAAQVRARAAARGVPVREPEPRLLGDVRLEVPSHYQRGRSLNDNSIVLRLVHGEVSVLLAGDVEALAELELARHDLRARLLKAPHHGSRTSSTDAFLRRVAPEAVVYSVGLRNSFQFPNPDVVARTRALGATTFRTDEGAVIAESDGATLRMTRFEPEPLAR